MTRCHVLSICYAFLYTVLSVRPWRAVLSRWKRDCVVRWRFITIVAHAAERHRSCYGVCASIQRNRDNVIVTVLWQRSHTALNESVSVVMNSFTWLLFFSYFFFYFLLSLTPCWFRLSRIIKIWLNSLLSGAWQKCILNSANICIYVILISRQHTTVYGESDYGGSWDSWGLNTN